MAFLKSNISISLSAMLRYVALLSGSTAVPPTESKSLGYVAIVILEDEGVGVATLELENVVAVKGVDLLAGAATIPDADDAMSLLVLLDANRSPRSGSFCTTTVFDPSKGTLHGLLTTDMVHATVFTEANSGTGEIRGQVSSVVLTAMGYRNAFRSVPGKPNQRIGA